ncbi:MAG TPA: glycoside hydrolase family 57, partial [Methanomicrobia archaeon]|nr:glycoside hydrolase family 57 [Methanomicrobia archaeon]HEX58665.1 glycoside hydrolase family 57 [Methanomicrobia archaeon]
MMIFHALGLHMHQPPQNLVLLLETDEWEARQIALCYERPLKYVKRYEDVANLHLDFSGTLLEQLTNEDIVKKFSDIGIDLGFMREYVDARRIEFLGSGYYHPVFPLIPKDDWKPQILRWRRLARKLGFRDVKGFWPPEMGFCMELIPTLRETGFKYTIVDGFHVVPLEEMSMAELLYKPHIASYEGCEITIIPRDRDLSNAQQSGLDPTWFENEVISKLGRLSGVSAVAERRRQSCGNGRNVEKRSLRNEDFLITTWSDGENGGWFRNLHEPSNFWGRFFAPYMEKVREGISEIIPISITEFLKENCPETEVFVETGAWNVEGRSGVDFSQWAGTEAQRKALEEVWSVSREFHKLKKQGRLKNLSKELLERLETLILRAETSCNFFWGETFLGRAYEDV